MSSTRQAVVFGPSFTGLGSGPSLTPCHQVDLLMGIGPRGGDNGLETDETGLRKHLTILTMSCSIQFGMKQCDHG